MRHTIVPPRTGEDFWRLGVLCLLAALGGCDAAPAPAPGEAHDPVMSEALQQPLLSDPDLSQANGRNLAIVPPGPAGTVQPVPKGP